MMMMKMMMAGNNVISTMTAAVLLVMVMVMGGGSSSSTPSSSSSSSSSCSSSPNNPSVMWELPSEEMTYYSDVVILGKVLRTWPEPEQPQLYRVQVMVHCVFKGQSVPRVIEVWEAGNVSEACWERRLDVGRAYLMFLYKHTATIYSPAFSHLPDTQKDEMFVVCDLNITKPTGPVPEGEVDNETCVDNRPQYEYGLNDHFYDFYPEDDYPNQSNCLLYVPKPGDHAKKMKKPRNLLVGKSEKVKVDIEEERRRGGGGEGQEGGAEGGEGVGEGGEGREGGGRDGRIGCGALSAPSLLLLLLSSAVTGLSLMGKLW